MLGKLFVLLFMCITIKQVVVVSEENTCEIKISRHAKGKDQVQFFKHVEYYLKNHRTIQILSNFLSSGELSLELRLLIDLSHKTVTLMPNFVKLSVKNKSNFWPGISDRIISEANRTANSTGTDEKHEEEKPHFFAKDLENIKKEEFVRSVKNAFNNMYYNHSNTDIKYQFDSMLQDDIIFTYLKHISMQPEVIMSVKGNIIQPGLKNIIKILISSPENANCSLIRSTGNSKKINMTKADNHHAHKRSTEGILNTEKRESDDNVYSDSNNSTEKTGFVSLNTQDKLETPISSVEIDVLETPSSLINDDILETPISIIKDNIPELPTLTVADSRQGISAEDDISLKNINVNYVDSNYHYDALHSGLGSNYDYGNDDAQNYDENSKTGDRRYETRSFTKNVDKIEDLFTGEELIKNMKKNEKGSYSSTTKDITGTPFSSEINENTVQDGFYDPVNTVLIKVETIVKKTDIMMFVTKNEHENKIWPEYMQNRLTTDIFGDMKQNVMSENNNYGGPATGMFLLNPPNALKTMRQEENVNEVPNNNFNIIRSNIYFQDPANTFKKDMSQENVDINEGDNNNGLLPLYNNNNNNNNNNLLHEMTDVFDETVTNKNFWSLLRPVNVLGTALKKTRMTDDLNTVSVIVDDSSEPNNYLILNPPREIDTGSLISRLAENENVLADDTNIDYGNIVNYPLLPQLYHTSGLANTENGKLKNNIFSSGYYPFTGMINNVMFQKLTNILTGPAKERMLSGNINSELDDDTHKNLEKNNQDLIEVIKIIDHTDKEKSEEQDDMDWSLESLQLNQLGNDATAEPEDTKKYKMSNYKLLDPDLKIITTELSALSAETLDKNHIVQRKQPINNN